MQEFISTLADAFGSYGDRNSAPCDGEIDTSLDYGVDNKNTSLNAVAAECHGPRKVRIMCPIENPESRVISAYKRVGRLLKSAHRMR